MTAAPMPINETASSRDTEKEVDQYLTFMLADEEYGVDILKVQEIKGWDNVTSIPNTPDYLLGVINLRGTVVPIVDLRKRFGLQKSEFGATTVVIVVRIVGEDGQARTVGLVMDAVSEVYDVPEDAFSPPPDFGTSVSVEFVKGLATVDDKMVILLDIDRLIDAGVIDSASQDSTVQETN